jgi:NAD(P)H-dependent flavin oxidoreductase YrpB (nitropropane dioxygenase family)
MTLRTPLSERIGIEHPFMQAGMGGIGPMTLAPLAAAISNAGALGTLAHPALLLEDPGRADIDVDRPLAINVRIAQEQPDAPHVIRAILDERSADSRVREQLGSSPHRAATRGPTGSTLICATAACSTSTPSPTSARPGWPRARAWTR